MTSTPTLLHLPADTFEPSPPALAPAAVWDAQAIPNEAELLNLVNALRQLERDFKLGNRFNLFDALNMGKHEIRHSRFLAYLLDPQERHGLGDRFLRKLLMLAADNHPNPPVGQLALAIRDLGDATVYCERDRFDIAVQVPALGLLLVIENKVGAKESDEQLKSYRERAHQRYPQYQFMGCFLTPDGIEGEDPDWGTMSYTHVADVIRSVQSESSIAPDVALSLSHYIDLIERKIVTPQALVDACREIYRTHKLAFDLVMEHGQQSLLAQAFESFEAQNTQLTSTAARSNTLYFAHQEWLQMPGAQLADRKRWTSQFPVVFWFELTEKKLMLRLELGPMSDGLASQRTALENRLKLAYPTRIAKTSKNDVRVFTRILTISEKIQEDPTSNDVLNAMEKLWKKWELEHGGTERVTSLVRAWVEELDRTLAVTE